MAYLGEKVFSVNLNERQPDSQQETASFIFDGINGYGSDRTSDHSEPSVSVTGQEVFLEAGERTISDDHPLKILMLKGEKGDPGTPGSAGDYETLINKPQINSYVLIGDQTLEQLGAQYLERLTNGEIEALLS